MQVLYTVISLSLSFFFLTTVVITQLGFYNNQPFRIFFFFFVIYQMEFHHLQNWLPDFQRGTPESWKAPIFFIIIIKGCLTQISGFISRRAIRIKTITSASAVFGFFFFFKGKFEAKVNASCVHSTVLIVYIIIR